MDRDEFRRLPFDEARLKLLSECGYGYVPYAGKPQRTKIIAVRPGDPGYHGDGSIGYEVGP